MSQGIPKLFHRDVFFAANGFGPFACFECGAEIAFEDVVVHHVDHDHTNNDANNLVPSHFSCHSAYHMRVRTVSDETRQRMSAAQKKRYSDAKQREHAGIVGARAWKDPEFRKRHSAAVAASNRRRAQ